MSWAKRHPFLLGVIVLPLVLIVGLWANDSLQRRAFYEQHPLLKEMDAQPFDLRREIITRYVPLGTARADVILVMSQEGFRCRPWVDSRGRDRVDCSLLQQPAGYGRTGRRLIQLSFNQNDTLVDASELPLK